jgi:hypothetical protein
MKTKTNKIPKIKGLQTLNPSMGELGSQSSLIRNLINQNKKSKR